MNLKRHRIQFPEEILTIQLGIPQEYKQQCIDEIYRLGDSMNHQTNLKAIMSTYKVWEETDVFNKLLNNIKIAINIGVPITDSKLEYVLEDAWSATYKKGHYSATHHHLPSTISFVYYLQSSGNTPLVFDKCNFQINPIDDMLILFPSYLPHSVPKHSEENDRICLAGNVKDTLKSNLI